MTNANQANQTTLPRVGVVGLPVENRIIGTVGNAEERLKVNGEHALLSVTSRRLPTGADNLPVLDGSYGVAPIKAGKYPLSSADADAVVSTVSVQTFEDVLAPARGFVNAMILGAICWLFIIAVIVSLI